MTVVTRRNGRLEFLDALRGLAAFVVVFYHLGSSTSAWMHRWTFERFNLGAFAVCVFFFVSGFIIPVSLQRYSLAQFWRSRFFRLVPAYWLVMALTLGMSAAGLMAWEQNLDRHHPLTWLLNLVMLSRLAGKPTLVSVSWTLGLELIFYVLCSCLKALGFLHRRRAVAWAAMGGCLFLMAAAGMNLYPPHYFKGSWIGLLLAAFVGSVYYDVVEERCSETSALVLLIAYAVVSTLAIRFEVQHGLSIGDGVFHVSQLVVSWLAAAALFLLAVKARGISYPSAVLWLGRISYSLYLVHSLPWLRAIGVSQRLSKFTEFGLALLASLLVADVVYRFVERPCLRLAKGAHRGEQTSPGAPVLGASS